MTRAPRARRGDPRAPGSTRCRSTSSRRRCRSCRDVFDLMPTATERGLGASRHPHDQGPGGPRAAGPRALRASAASEGSVAPRRQVEACIEQCADLTADDGYFATLRRRAPRPAARRLDRRGARATSSAASRPAADGLPARSASASRASCSTRAPEADACGPRALPAARRATSSAPRSTSRRPTAWGQRGAAPASRAEMRQVAERIEPGATVKEAIAALDADPRIPAARHRRAQGVDAGPRPTRSSPTWPTTHFDIPEPVRTIECMIAPTQTGGIYYTGPSDDFSRPGRMWWSVPKGVTEFGTWTRADDRLPRGRPGPPPPGRPDGLPLRAAQQVAPARSCWTSGHGEGWALYAERLMAELGYMDDPGNRMGCSTASRCARRAWSSTSACTAGSRRPTEVGGGAWTYDKAWQFLTDHANQGEALLRFELNRYLGWPGQAPSYKIGERLWLQLRDEVKRARGRRVRPQGLPPPGARHRRRRPRHTARRGAGHPRLRPARVAGAGPPAAGRPRSPAVSS